MGRCKVARRQLLAMLAPSVMGLRCPPVHMTDKKRAWKDARRDYVYEHARKRAVLWRVFWAITLLGLGYRFFGVEVWDD